jgi:hypothetical protein
MNYLLIALVIVLGYLSFYCGKLNAELYSSGLTNKSSRLSLAKIHAVSKLVKSDNQKYLLKKCKVWYYLYLLVFYAFLIFGAIKIFVL